MKPKTSYGELLLRSFVKKIFPKEKLAFNIRFAKIFNPETGKPLELDIYLPDKKVAFEFHGRQHKTDEYQRYKDKIKRAKCKELGILLIEVWTANLNKELLKKVDELCTAHGVNITFPNNAYLQKFHVLGTQYKNRIYKMNSTLKSKTFVKRKKR